MCLSLSPDELRPAAFRVTQAEEAFFHASHLPYHHQNDQDWLSRLEPSSLMEGLSANLTAPSWPAGELPLFLVTILFRILFGPVTYDAGQPAFLGAASITPLSSLGLLKLSDGLILSSLVVNGFAFCITRNTLLGGFGCCPSWKEHCLGQPMYRPFFRSKGKFYVTIHSVFGNIGNGCADCVASQGSRGLVSQDNLPSFWSDRRLLIDPLLSVSHCLSHFPEVLHNLVIELQLE